ncbi:uncharacterized protein LOC124540931 [Vanessa cardui]|uniref:uncharacterized protein LOC124540931 n=1 Tax=Vanessa cardui TaxID=171605 RepID=UPI001F12F8B1|nr:uncharacterized protein LOC124540931 [Vanessa cardui]
MLEFGRSGASSSFFNTLLHNTWRVDTAIFGAVVLSPRGARTKWLTRRAGAIFITPRQRKPQLSSKVVTPDSSHSEERILSRKRNLCPATYRKFLLERIPARRIPARRIPARRESLFDTMKDNKQALPQAFASTPEVSKRSIGKLERTLAAAESGVPSTSYRLFVTDKKTKLSFLVDTGANISVLPRRQGQNTTPLPFKLYAANNTTISTYGEKTLELDLNLRRPYKWKFIVADVSKPILGADFLNHHQLIVDLKNQRLIDAVTNLKINAPITSTDTPTVRSIDIRNAYHEILAEFPGTTRLTAMQLKPKINVEHYIETQGPPIHCRARPIPPHRYEKVKKEFENMIQQGLCRLSKSPWSSPLHIVHSYSHRQS